MFIVFDLDGTLREISHRRHLAKSGKWNGPGEFFLSCDNDAPVWPVINIMFSLVDSGHKVQIWSGASEISRQMTIDWFKKHTKRDVTDLLVHMRAENDYTPDQILKENWLKAEASPPDMIFDDRQKVVDMWRGNGIVCSQVAPGDFDTKEAVVAPRVAVLTMMIGPSGGGKSTFLANTHNDANIVSSDDIRRRQYPSKNSWADAEAYTQAGFDATFGTIQAVVKGYLDGGVDVVYDATNIRRKNRIEFLKAVGADTGKFKVVYIIVDRPLEDKLRDHSSSSDPLGRTSEDIIRKHHRVFQSSKKHAQNGDGFDFVTVFST